LGVVALLLTGLGLAKFRQVKAAVAASNFQPPPEAVTTLIAKQDTWPTTLDEVGTMVAVHGVTVAADLPGTVDKIHFESGRSVEQGEILVELDTRQERAQLAAMEAQWDLANINYDRYQRLQSEGVISRQDYDKAIADKKQTEANVGEIKATIDRKTIRAPFSGELGIRQVNLGQYLAAGSPIVALQSLDPIYVNFSVPQQQVGSVRIGGRVTITAENQAGERTGRISAVDSVVSEATRNVQVQATLANPGGELQPGMFVRGQLAFGQAEAVIALPASSISYAPYGNSVFVVGELEGPNSTRYRGVRQQFVKVGSSRGDQVAVVSGLKAGDEVVSSGAFKLRNGAAVRVNNEVQPSNNPAPKPEDN